MKQLVYVKSIVGNDERKKVSLVIELDMLLLETFLSRNNIFESEPDDGAKSEIEDVNHPLVVLWNETKHEKLNFVNKVDAALARNIRLAMVREPDLDRWKKGIEAINDTHWMLGHNATRWKATFAWFISVDRYGENKLSSILDGKIYSSRWEKKR